MKKIPTDEEIKGFIPQEPFGRQYRTAVLKNWRCPCCNRTTQEQIFWTKNSRSGGSKLIWDFISKHHCRGRKERFQETSVCNTCNVTEGRVKLKLNIPTEFCFSVSEMSQFIRVSPHNIEVQVDLSKAQEIWKTAKLEIFTKKPEVTTRPKTKKIGDKEYDHQALIVRRAWKNLRRAKRDIVRMKRAFETTRKKQLEKEAKLNEKHGKEINRLNYNLTVEIRKLQRVKARVDLETLRNLEVRQRYQQRRKETKEKKQQDREEDRVRRQKTRIQLLHERWNNRHLLTKIQRKQLRRELKQKDPDWLVIFPVNLPTAELSESSQRPPQHVPSGPLLPEE